MQGTHQPSSIFQQNKRHDYPDRPDWFRLRAICEIHRQDYGSPELNNGPDEPKYLLFRRVPTDVDVIIHGVSLTPIPNNDEDLEEEVKKAFKVTHKFEIAGAKFLKPKEKDRRDKKATSIIIWVPEVEVDNVTPSVLFMGKYKTSAVMWQASITTQCPKC